MTHTITPAPQPQEEGAARHSPLPWTCEAVRNADAEYSEGGPESHKGFDAFQIIDAKGRVLFDSLNRDVAASLIEEHHDDEGVDAWDAEARRDAKFIIEACNAHARQQARIVALEKALQTAAERMFDCNQEEYSNEIRTALAGGTPRTDACLKYDLLPKELARQLERELAAKDAQAAADSARLDWLNMRLVNVCECMASDTPPLFEHVPAGYGLRDDADIRAAIDAARRKEAT